MKSNSIELNENLLFKIIISYCYKGYRKLGFLTSNKIDLMRLDRLIEYRHKKYYNIDLNLSNKILNFTKLL